MKSYNPLPTYNNNKKNIVQSYFFILSIGIYIFLSWLMPSKTLYWGIFLSCVDFIYIIFHLNLKVKINISTVSLLLFILISFFGSLISGEVPRALKYVFSLILFYINYILLSNEDKWRKSFFTILKGICFFFVVGNIIQIISPMALSAFNSIFLNGDQLSESINFINNNTLTLVGFTHQPGRNGYILSVTLTIILAEFITQDKKRMKYLYGILYLLVFYLILLTRKRGFVFFNIFIIFCLLFITSKNKLKTVVSLVALLSIFVYLFSYTEAGVNLMKKFFLQDDISSGRFFMNEIMWNDFTQNPLLGKGTYTTVDVFAVGHGHNVYLQVLRENGIFAFFFFVISILYNFINSFKIIKRVKLTSEASKYILISTSLQLIFILWCFTGNPLYDPFTLILYFVGIAIPCQIELETDINPEGID